MLQQSVEAHRRAIELDPAATTSIAHTLFLTGDYKSAIEVYGGRTGYYLDAAAWAALGDEKRAIDLLHERLDRMSLSKVMTALMTSLLAILEGNNAQGAALMEKADTTREPEILVYFARHYAKIGKVDLAAKALRKAAETGFICAPQTLNSDIWLSKFRKHPDFHSLLRAMEGRIQKAKKGFVSSSGSPPKISCS
jgi:tetratricopeptide (TPR) repeat protein